MPSKYKSYEWTKFPPETIKRANAVFLEQSKGETTERRTSFSVQVGDATWTLDTEDEFFAEYRGETGTAEYQRGRRYEDGWNDFSVNYWHTLNRKTSVRVRLDTRAAVEAVFEVFEDAREAASVKPPPKPEPEAQHLTPVTVFVGHGKSGDWRDLADHLRDHQGLLVETFESEPRAGIGNFEVVLDIARSADFAVLVHTPEDESADGAMRARQNVVHETGLFQATLGPRRAIIVRKEGCEDFSNLDGVQEIRYGAHIREVFGEVLAVVKREYPSLQVAADRHLGHRYRLR